MVLDEDPVDETLTLPVVAEAAAVFYQLEREGDDFSETIHTSSRWWCSSCVTVFVMVNRFSVSQERIPECKERVIEVH